MGEKQIPLRYMLLLLALIYFSSALRASALRLAKSDEVHGKLIHLKLDQEFVAVFGFELVNIKKDVEIASADEWQSLALNLCEANSELECSQIQVSNSEQHPEKMRQGVRMSKQYFNLMLPKLLQQVHVDIFHAATDLRFWVNPIYDSGPVARLEFWGHHGEERLFSSTLMTFLSSGNTVLALAGEPSSDTEFAEFRRSIEQALLKHAHKPPLLYFLGNVGADVTFKETSLFPEECVLVGTDYWTNDPQTIHATPDRSFKQTQVPIMTTACHAEDMNLRKQDMTLESINTHAATLNDYIFVYGERKEIGNELLARLQRETMLPVVVMSKLETCAEDLTGIGVTCLEKVMGVVQFHQILKGARLVISECLNTDNPTLLETLRCGTPVLVRAGRHEFLDAYGERPYVMTWDNTSELFHAVHEAIGATSMGDHKLLPWTPTPLRDDVMRDGLGNLLRMKRQSCDRAL